MKKKFFARKVLSALVAFVMLVTMMPLSAIPVSATTSFTQQNVLQVNANSRSDYISGSWYSLTNGSGNIRDAGCGIVSLVSAVYNLGGTIEKSNIGSVIDEVFDWAYSKGYWTGSAGTYWSMFVNSDDKFGAKYGFLVSKQYGSKDSESTSLTSLVNHIKNGNGTAVVHVYGHFMAVVDYKFENGKEMLRVFDPAPGAGSNYNSLKRKNVTHAAGDWFELSVLQRDGGTKGSQGSTENIEIDGYWLISPTGTGSTTTSNSTNPDSYPVCERDLVYNSTVEIGDDVKWVQCVLKHLGYSIDIDGSYGPSSRDTIKKFQSAYGLTVDGQCGPNTRAKLKEVWASKGHIWNSGTVVTDATHTATGTKEFKCNYCEATKTETIAKLTGHTYSSWEKHDSLLHKKTCLCGDTQYANHTWNSGTVTTQSTCTATGLRTYTCTGCNATKTEAISVKGHNYGSWQNHNSTQHKKTCSCGDVQYANHTWNSGTTTKAATHTEEGIKTYTCTGCNATKTEAIAKLSGHTYGAWENYDRLQHKRVCACGSYEFSDHSWDNGIITTPATNTKEGTKTFTCLTCNAKKTESVPKIENSDTVAKIIVSNHEVAADGTIKVTISIKENPGVASIILQIAYDNSMLTLTSVEYNSTIGGQTVNPSNLSSPVTLYWINAFENMSGDVVFATLTFKADENSMVGASSNIVISYNAEDIYNIDEENVSLDIQNGTVTIIDYVPGDINGDGELNNKDVSRLMQYFAGWDVEVNEATLDVNGDGLLNNKDASRLMQYLVGWDVDIY